MLNWEHQTPRSQPSSNSISPSGLAYLLVSKHSPSSFLCSQDKAGVAGRRLMPAFNVWSMPVSIVIASCLVI